jgi:undecaprenyl-diphosphatase
MIEWLDKIDRELFLALNGLHIDALDPIFWYISESLTWIPLYVLIIFVMFKYYGWNGFAFVLCMIAAVGLSDHIASGIFKPWVGRLRPSHDPTLKDIVYVLLDPNGNYYRGGQFSFMSSHASTTFAVATSTYLTLRPRYSWIWVMFIWCTLVAYSRIYLGVHYPGDIIAGGSIGILMGVLFFALARKINNRLVKTKKNHV